MNSCLRLLLPAILLSLSCGALSRGSEPAPAALASTSRPPSVPPTPEPPAYIPPQCETVPIATLPATTPVAEATPGLQANSALTTNQQQDVLNGLVNAVLDHYIYPEAAGEDWLSRVAALQTKIVSGMDSDGFYAELQLLVQALGDDHSYFQSPVEVANEATAIAGTYSFVGIGALFGPLEDKTRAAVLVTFDGGPAWHAGLQPHDTLMAVDGGPIRDPFGRSRTLGPECSAVVLTVQTPGQQPRDLTLIRSSVAAPIPIYPRLVPTSDGSKVGYIFIATLLDQVVSETVRQALEELGPLDGLILDNRMNGGGLGSASEQILGLFTSGHVGDYVLRGTSEPWEIESDPIHNSQDVSLVVLVGEDTVSYGEIVSGVLADIGRAHLVGQATLGNVEQLRDYEFEDGSRAWLASARFEPAISKADWETTGILPEVEVIAGWDTFTFETDPAIAAALELLGH